MESVNPCFKAFEVCRIIWLSPFISVVGETDFSDAEKIFLLFWCLIRMDCADIYLLHVSIPSSPSDPKICLKCEVSDSRLGSTYSTLNLLLETVVWRVLSDHKERHHAAHSMPTQELQNYILLSIVQTLESVNVCRLHYLLPTFKKFCYNVGIAYYYNWSSP